jgi:serine/threonine-protein kinase
VPPAANLSGGVQGLTQLVNAVLAYFTVGPVLGIGRTGVVFRALDTRDRSEVALKVFAPEFSRDEEEVMRFTRAAKTMAPLRHLNLVGLIGGGREHGRCWLSMELVEGPSVAWLVQQAAAGQVDWRAGLRVLHHATRALIYLHGKQVMHRNLTPENLLMNRSDGLVKVGDLIAAKAQEGKLALDVTAEGAIRGNLYYLAPERTLGGPTAGDARSDLYSLGAVVYAVLTGRPPFQEETAVETIAAVRNEDPVPPRLLEPFIPEALEEVVLRLLAKEPEGRFQDATELLRHLVRQRLIDS